MAKYFHISISIRGALMNWNETTFKKGFLTIDDKGLNFNEARMALMDELSKGREFIPCRPCDNFNPKKGCEGHSEKPED